MKPLPIIGVEEHIASAEADLRVVSAELEKWTNFKVSGYRHNFLCLFDMPIGCCTAC